MRQALAFAVVVSAVSAGTSAVACSVVLPRDYEGSAEQNRNVHKAVASATAIIDGEVVRPWTDHKPALVRVARILKGSVGEFVEVGGPGAGGDCSIALDRQGERSRMILTNGPTPYDLYRDYSEYRLEDRLLKSDRRKVWPYFRGQESAR